MPAAHAVHVLDGGAEKLLEENGEGQEAESGPHPEAPLPRQTGGGREEAHATQSQPHYECHWGTVTQQGVSRLPEPPQFYLLLQDMSLRHVQAWGATQGVVEGLHLQHSPCKAAEPLMNLM